MEFNKETLARLFAAVDTDSLDSEAKDAYALLKTLCTSNSAADRTDGRCIDLYNLNLYKSALLWEGEEDVRCVLDSGVFDEYLQGLDDDQYDALVDAITNVIDWDGESFCGGTVGNEVISREIEKYLMKNEFIHSEDCRYSCTEYAVKTLCVPVEIQDEDPTDFIRRLLSENGKGKGDSARLYRYERGILTDLLSK